MRLLFYYFVAIVVAVTSAGAAIPASTYSLQKQPGYVENKGQILDQFNKPNTSVRYLLSRPGLNIQLKANSFSYDSYIEKTLPVKDKSTAIHQPKEQQHESFEQHFHRVDVELVGANPAPLLHAIGASDDYQNYYTTGLGEEGVTNVRNYARIVYVDIYPHIDLEFFLGSQGEAEYQFIIHPGGDASVIRLHYKGASSTSLTGNLIELTLRHGSISEHIPKSYLAESGRELRVKFQKIEMDMYGYSVPNYALDQTLVIDPTPSLKWGTYFGGSKNDGGNCIATDQNNGIYIGGSTFSTASIATVGAHQVVYVGACDVFIAAFTKDGLRRWSTYYGGSQPDAIGGIDVDPSGNIFIVGTTESDNGISTSGAYQVAKLGSDNAFVASFTNTGVRSWSTYYGGKIGERGSYGIDLTIGKSGNVLITGLSTSSDAIATAGTHQQTNAGNSDAFIASFSNVGVRQWGTFYGGGLNEHSTGITTDKNGNVYIAGITASTGGIVLTGSSPHQSSLKGSEDAFIAKFTSSGNLLWSTYYGGDDVDYGDDIKVDTTGAVFIVGGTNSTNFISTNNGYQPTFGGANGCDQSCTSIGWSIEMGLVNSSTGAGDIFLAKFSEVGALIWGTYYGGNDCENGSSLALDRLGNAYLIGTTNSSSSVFASSTAYQQNNNGECETFIAKFLSNGMRDWSTYYGGEAGEYGFDIAVDNDLNVFATGWTSSKNNIATPGAHQVVLSENSLIAYIDAFITRWEQCNELSISISSNKSSAFCLDDGMGVEYSLPFAPNSTYEWQSIRLGTITSLRTTDSSIMVNWTKTGTDTVRVRQTSTISGCYKDTMFIVTITPILSINLGADIVTCLGDIPTIGKIVSGGTAPYSYSWSPKTGIIGSDSTAQINVSPTITTTYTVSVTDKNGCQSQNGIQVTVHPKPSVYAGADTVICPGESIIIGNVATGTTGSYQYQWTPSIGLSSDYIARPTAKPPTDTTYRVIVTDKNGCKDTSEIKIRLSKSSIKITPVSLVFPELLGCDPAKDTVITLENPTALDVEISAIISTDPQFKVLTAMPLLISANNGKQVKIRYEPSASGTSKAILKVITEPCKSEVLFPISGSKQGVSFAVADTLDAGEIITCAKSSATVQLTIENTSSGGASGGVTVVTPGASITTTLKNGETLPNGTPQKYDVTITPLTDGNFLDSMMIVFNPCGITKMVYVKGKRTNVALKADITNLDFGKIPSGTNKPLPATFTNTGTAALTVTSVPNLNSPFSILSVTPPLPAILQPNDKLTVTIQYTGTTGVLTGKVFAFATLPCAISDSIALSGEGEVSALPSFSSTKFLITDSICIGKDTLLTARLANNGGVNLQVQQALATGSVDFTVLGFVPQTLASGNSMDVQVRYTPTSIGQANGKVVWVTDLLRDSTDLSGLGKSCGILPIDTAKTTISIQNIEANTGDKVQVTIKLTSEQGLAQSGATNFKAKLGFNRTILHITEPAIICNNGTNADRCEVEISGTRQSGSDILAVIPAEATLGNAERTNLELLSFEWLNGTGVVNVSRINGELILTDLCREGGVRLYLPTQTVSLSVVPNPASGNAEIEYTLREESAVKVSLVDVLGKEVMIIDEAVRPAGTYRKSVELSLAGDGVYYLRLQAPNVTKTVRMNVVK
ncbi:MAG: SBBP repeat-containing protein [Ignavibacteria bacterium]|nr:SBBP repeat-containing protein [Ignavibacteria bacterium]